MALPLYHQRGSPSHTNSAIQDPFHSYTDLTELQRRRVRLAVTFIVITTVLYLSLLSVVFVFRYEKITMLGVTHSCIRLATWYLGAIALALLSLAVWCIVGLVKYMMSRSSEYDKEVLKLFGVRIIYFIASGLGVMLLASWNYELAGIIEEIVEALTS